MLQTDDIDDDYFTPSSSTSLANIFGKPSNEDATDNDSLKYTPPKPSQHTPKPEEQKATQCIFACALVGYEWFNKAYILRGKLGFAILNILKTSVHNIILYDSKKVTLSNATISKDFEVTVKDKRYFSYRDNLQKYWSLYVSEEELNKILDLLKNFNVIVKYSSESGSGSEESKSQEHASIKKDEADNVEKESDTDFFHNKKPKVSLLSRMAHMGQSVLPPRVIPVDKSSDSSDTSDKSHFKAVRHKPARNIVKRNNSEKCVTECHSLVEAQNLMSRKEHSTESIPLFTYVNGQLVPVTNTNVITSPPANGGNDINYFISEQRINNSELRINMNRISDKLDKILINVPNVESADKSSSTNQFQVEVLKKLISEYENKIKVYEEFIRYNKSDDRGVNVTKLFANSEPQHSEQLKDMSLLKDKILQLEEICIEKDKAINSLSSEIKHMQIKYDENIACQKNDIEKLTNEIQNLNHELEMRNEEYSNLVIKHENQYTKNRDDRDIGDKIKNIMNDTFQAIAANLENDESYSGERVKAVVATVIKRVTIESLNSIK